MKKISIFLLFLFGVIWADSSVNAAVIVGRISHIEGEIYRYMDVDDSWVTTWQQSPAGTEDILLTGDDSRAEVTFPNYLMVRLAQKTEIEILNLEDDIGRFSLHKGLARFYNRSVAGELIVESARGTLKVKPGSVIDIQVDKQSATFAAVSGEAAFYSYDYGDEKVDIISGSTRLEFRNDSVLAARGPIDLNWDSWCAGRERIWAENRLVRSEHLPEPMQEYAYVMEPYGHWQRIYYRGYYYWAWRPHSIVFGWSPYTTGYWYDWHGSPVWIDYNPWGWITHHHGHWIHMHGAWMWTPYIHLSYVPGVTVIGFNIRFGKRFRPHWHPGRVRWIAHKDHVGWLPLAPWENYFGHRKWGPRSVVIRGGTSLSINVKLSNHRYIDHAVIIPKRYLFTRKHERDGYNRVRIHNARKTEILRNYRLVSITDESRHRNRNHVPEAGRPGNTKRENERRRAAGDFRRRESQVPERSGNNRGRSLHLRSGGTEEKNMVNSRENGRRRSNFTDRQIGTGGNEREKIRQRDKRNSIVRAHRQNREEDGAKNARRAARSRNAERDKQQRQARIRENEAGQAEVERSRRRGARPGNTSVSAGNDRPAEDRQPLKREVRRSRNTLGPKGNQVTRPENQNRRLFRGRDEVKAEERKRLAVENSEDNREKSVLSSGRDYSQRRRNRNAAPLKSHRFR
ncbi:MAG: FecR domain-containing protein [Deltaproteobacteria bacterium]|jgi:hypothetical protein|nr:FecR domain-containing protein [Deltaproteobacteria bacterium]